jgi:hypothetical protein
MLGLDGEIRTDVPPEFVVGVLQHIALEANHPVTKSYILFDTFWLN